MKDSTVIAIITGTNRNDKYPNELEGTNLADEIFGLAGNDSLIGFDGNDVLVGGAGADELFGSNGFDFASYAGSSRTPPWPSRCCHQPGSASLGRGSTAEQLRPLLCHGPTGRDDRAQPKSPSELQVGHWTVSARVQVSHK